ncbi:DNA-binding transcriptional regulator, FadR family [Thermomonospora echinospora]|uniref:DNA-binding transcriptional regulator, FadR family n=1 Tax=Thermomonospora echinospora TaxID=1992 RepID=A0A1H6DT20_9ACTN|nr:FCD domain-containing protein [Thermomonospora echinospora]SEG88542.1 DNA-binding transcriptional regulator, FadR family [Thermomonospora echinospora]
MVKAGARPAPGPDDDGPLSGTGDPGRAGGSVGKLAAQVARQIEAEVIRRGWPVGEILDSEPVLRERYGVSRTVLREAARLLEHHQVARMRRGPGGGLVICAPDAEPTVRAVVIYIEYANADLRDVLHARRLIEPLVGRLVTERINERGIAALRNALAAEIPPKDPGGWADNLFHAMLSEMTGNPVLQLFTDVLEQLAFRYVSLAARIPLAEVLRFTEISYRQHAEIVDATVAGDAPRAQIKLIEHLDEVAEWLGTGTDRERPGSIMPVSAVSPGLGMGATLAETVAVRIYEDIVAQGRPVGSVLGSEAELMERYETSRAVLRAAVRLLEHHSVATSRRGPGGGLVVTRPEPRAAVDAAALYLAYRGVTAENLHVVREAIEVGTTARVAARREEPDIARRLKTLADRPPGQARGDGSAVQDFHAELAELAGNPVLSLFLRIITDLSRRTRAAHGRPDSAGMCLDDSDPAHGEILSAIRDGDAGLAQHRMRRHLAP